MLYQLSYVGTLRGMNVWFRQQKELSEPAYSVDKHSSWQYFPQTMSEGVFLGLYWPHASRHHAPLVLDECAHPQAL